MNMEENRHCRERFGRAVKRLRRAEKVTLPALAERAGISKGTLSRIENGKSDPALTTMMKLADALYVTVYEIWKF